MRPGQEPPNVADYVVIEDESQPALPAAPTPPPTPPRPEPSWPRVLTTTVQLWLRRRRHRWIGWAVLLVVLTVAAASGLLLAGHTPARTRAGQAPAAPPRAPAAVAGQQAANWVTGQVSRSALVSCDAATCALLQHRGFPATSLLVLRPGALNPLDSNLIVVTATVRRDLGARLAADAPVVLAGFGAGRARAEVRAIAPQGAASYLSQLHSDFAARKSFGAELLGNRDIQADPQARQRLTAGLVDARVIAAINIMAALHQVHLVSFGTAAPGASAEVPLRSAVFYGVAHGATSATAAQSALRALLLSQGPSYRPAGLQAVRLPGGTGALRIWFDAPDPLGLLNASQPLVKIQSP